MTGFRLRALKEIANAARRKAIASATRGPHLARQREWAKLDEKGQLQQIRDHARTAKEDVLQHHARYLGQFVQAVQKRGGHVHMAATAQEAVQHVIAIARRRGAHLAVKSKSMATEEIHLNAALQEANIRSIETDLGEYIIQLAGERPVHIVGPAIHLTRYDIAELFTQHFGGVVPSDPEGLTAFARKVLRETFLTANLGITGANFGVAETGSVVLVTNEGNEGMVTTLPPVMITIMGLEKLVPTWADLQPFYKLLARSATGVSTTAYVSAITGPRSADEPDGPDELHIIVLDAGRSRILQSPYRSVLSCIRCGSCLNACPVFRQTGGHAYGGTYSGPIGVVLTPLLQGVEQAGDLLDACTVCGACTEACPVQIPLHEMILDERVERSRGASVSGLERLLFKFWAWAWSSAHRYRLTIWLLRLLGRPFARRGYMAWLPPPLQAWHQGRDFPAPAPRTFRERWSALQSEVSVRDNP